MILALSPGRDALGILYEQWIQCEGHWSENSLAKELRTSSRHRKIGSRKWMTRSELEHKYNSTRIAERIIVSKEQDAELSKTQIRPHPDCPDEPDSSLVIKSV